LILEIPQSLKMPETMMDRLADADHHGGRRSQSKPVCFAMHHQPFIGLAFEGADVISDLVIQDFPATAGHGIEPRRPETLKHLAHAQF
jgi:hypothetical protein